MTMWEMIAERARQLPAELLCSKVFAWRANFMVVIPAIF
jgi:hypothetical protein